jgi:hypothetical protein
LEKSLHKSSSTIIECSKHSRGGDCEMVCIV